MAPVLQKSKHPTYQIIIDLHLEISYNYLSIVLVKGKSLNSSKNCQLFTFASRKQAANVGLELKIFNGSLRPGDGKFTRLTFRRPTSRGKSARNSQ